MPKVPLHRFCFTVVLSLFLLSVMTCGAPNDRIAPPANDCARGSGTAEKTRPVVCVSNTPNGIVVSPESIELWDVQPNDKKTSVMIHWVTRGGGNLQIQMKDEGCLEKPKCDQNGHCHAKAIDVTGTKRCKYGITLDGKELDPEVVVTDCC